MLQFSTTLGNNISFLCSKYGLSRYNFTECAMKCRGSDFSNCIGADVLGEIGIQITAKGPDVFFYELHLSCNDRVDKQRSQFLFCVTAL